MKSASSDVRAAGRGGEVARAVAALALTAMAGALWMVGYLVAPTLFALLEKERAGAVAGQLFTSVAWIVMVATALLLVLERTWLRGSGRWVAGCLWAILFLALAGHFGMRPHIAELKAAQAAAQLDAEAFRSAFARAHGISAILFLLQSVLAAVLVAGWRR